MYKLLSAFLIAVAFFACGPLPHEEEAESAVGITAPDGYAVACQSGYQRTQPHFCASNSNPTITMSPATLDSTCRNFDLTSLVPLSTKYVLSLTLFLVASNNVAASREVDFSLYSDTLCTVVFTPEVVQVREQVATVAGTTLLLLQKQLLLPVVGQKVYYVGASTGGAGSTVDILSLPGYYD